MSEFFKSQALQEEFNNLLKELATNPEWPYDDDLTLSYESAPNPREIINMIDSIIREELDYVEYGALEKYIDQLTAGQDYWESWDFREKCLLLGTAPGYVQHLAKLKDEVKNRPSIIQLIEIRARLLSIEDAFGKEEN